MVRISDKKLLEIIQRNARMKNTDIARELGVTEGAIRKRLKELEKRGVIKGYNAKIDIKALGYSIDTLIGVDTSPEAYIHIIENLKRKRNVIQLWTSTGDHMIMFRAWFENNDKMRSFVKALERTEGVVKVCPAILVEEIK